MASSPAAIKQRATKIEESLVRALRIPGDRTRVQRRLLKLAEEDPKSAVTILLKFYDHENPKVHDPVRSLLEKVTGTKEGMRAVVDNVVNPNQLVRRNAVTFLTAKRGFHAKTFASFYEHTHLLMAMARNKEIPVEDIEALAEVSKDTYLEGETIEALQDIAASLDFIKQRHRTADTLRGYVAEMLRLAPDLTRMGAYDGSIEEPLRRAIIASKSRTVDETKDIISVRSMEASIRNELKRIGRFVKGAYEKRPSMNDDHLSGKDVIALSRLHAFIDTVTSKAIAGKREEGLKMLNSYLKGEYVEFFEQSQPRIKVKDSSVLASIYITGVVMLKLASFLMSQTAEDVYQRYFRGFEAEPSVHIMPWPDPIVKIII